MSDVTPTGMAAEAGLTPRQREVLALIARGLTNYEIAETLGVSLAGAKWHVSELLSKLGVATREEAAQYWRRRNRPAARLQRFARALVAAPALKIAGAAVLGSASVAALAVALPHGSGDSPAASEVTATTTPTVVAIGSTGRADMTVEEASQLAVAAADTALKDAGLDSLDVYGEPLSVEHLILVQRGFRPLASGAVLVPIGQPTPPAPPSSDIWSFVYRLDGFAPPAGSPWVSASVQVVVIIDDDRREVTMAGAEQRDGAESGMTAAGDWSVPAVVTYMDEDERITVSLYGVPAGGACARVDDTRTQGHRPDPLDGSCELRNLKHAHLYVADVRNAIGDSASPVFVAVTSKDVVRAIVQYGDGTEEDAALLPTTGPYVDYVQIILQRVEAGRGASMLVGLGTDGTVLGSYPLLADAGRDAPVLGTEGTGSGETEVFEIPDSGRAYPFFFEFRPAVPVVLTAACDSGEVILLETTGPIPPTIGSMMIQFPAGSTRCSLRVETEPGAEWRLSSK